MRNLKLVLAVLLAVAVTACSKTDSPQPGKATPEARCAGLAGQDLVKCVEDERKADKKEREFLQLASTFGKGAEESGGIFGSGFAGIFQNVFLGTLLVVAFLLVNFIPTIVAVNRKHRNKLPIFLLNLFLGWTLVGWVGALVWATLKDSSET